MRNVLTCLLLVFTLPLAAQDGEISVEPSAVVKEILLDNLDEGFEDVTAVSVTNNTRRTLQLVQSAITVGEPGAWTYRVSGRGARTAPYTTGPARSDKPLSLGPGETAIYHVALRPDGIGGTGRVELRFSDLTVPGRTLGQSSIATKILRRPALGSDGEVAPSVRAERPATSSGRVTRLYPNPAKERFFVEVPAGVKIGRVEVSNTLGRKLRRFDGPAGEEGYDIEKLPDGLYLITVFDENGKQLKTLRLLHRQFGA